MKHQTQINGFESLEVLAEQIGNLRYDALIEFMTGLEKKLMRDSLADNERGRPMLSMHLHRARYSIGEARVEMERAWKICEPYMREPDNGAV